MLPLFHPNISDISLEGVLYSLSEDTRLCIVSQLFRLGEQSCKQFDNLAGKTALSHHYKVLREKGLINVRIEGRNRYLSLRLSELNEKFPNLLETIISSSKY
jgi:DNA-binding transcriptional ArsR family regulator